MTNEPCKICGSAVRIEKREMGRSLGQLKGEEVDVRLCTSPECPSNTGKRALGSTV